MQNVTSKESICPPEAAPETTFTLASPYLSHDTTMDAVSITVLMSKYGFPG